MYKVRKRDGKTADFDIGKISAVLTKAFDAVGKNTHPTIIDMLSLKVAADFDSKIKDGVIDVEDIQDSVEKVLSQSGYSDVAKEYILYRKQRERVRNTKSTLLDYKETMNQYLNLADWRVKENSTVSYSIGGLILSNSGAMTANYWLSEVYDDEIGNAHRNADIHIHDLSMLSGYCAGWSLKQLIQEGLGGVPGKISSAPASHLSTLCNQMVNFLGILQNEWAGAQAFSSFDTYLAPFVKADNLSYKEVKQALQSFVFGTNTPSRWGCCKETTQIFTPDGWKHHDELKVGDTIFTWVDGEMREAKLKHIIYHKNDYGVLHQHTGRNYVQTVTPDHRCLVESGAQRGQFIIKQSIDLFGGKCKDLRMPFFIDRVTISDCNDSFTDDEIRLAAMYYTDGNASMDDISIFKSPRRDTGEITEVLESLCLDYSLYKQSYPRENGTTEINKYRIRSKHRSYMEELIGNKYKINEKFLHLSPRQSKLFIDTWAKFDGSTNGRLMCQYDNDDVGDALQIIMLRAGYISHKWERKKKSDKKATKYIFVDQRRAVVVSRQDEIEYDGYVWCPNTDDGTAIFKDENDNIFISGNCQAPFTNITIDWVVPNDLAELNAIVGGKEMDFKYKDCQKEMDMVNKAFIEIMIEGDANGRGFQYPIKFVA